MARRVCSRTGHRHYHPIPTGGRGMRKLFGGIVVAALALLVTTAAQAQRRTTTSASMGGAKHELGVDLGAAYVSSNLTGVSGGIVIVTPLDLRVGFVPRSGKIMWEPRLNLNFSTVGGSTTYLLTPQMNLLYANSVVAIGAACTSPAVPAWCWATIARP